MAVCQDTGTGQGQPRSTWCSVVPTGDQEWLSIVGGLVAQLGHGHPFCSPLICTNSPGCFFVFVVCFFKKKNLFFLIESRYFKNTSKGYNQVMKMSNIIKDDTKIFTKIFTKAILKIIDLHTEHIV